MDYAHYTFMILETENFGLIKADSEKISLCILQNGTNYDKNFLYIGMILCAKFDTNFLYTEV